jgi:hypothetical protein
MPDENAGSVVRLHIGSFGATCTNRDDFPDGVPGGEYAAFKVDEAAALVAVTEAARVIRDLVNSFEMDMPDELFIVRSELAQTALETALDRLDEIRARAT